MSDRCLSSLPRTSDVSLDSRRSSRVRNERVSRKSRKVRAMVSDDACDLAEGEDLEPGLRFVIDAWIERSEKSLAARTLLRYEHTLYIV